MSRATLGIITANYARHDLGSLVDSRTVATVPFGGRYRLIDFPLSNFVNSGITTVGLITPYYYRSIMDHVGAGKPWELARKIGGLYILPGTVYGEREEGSRFLIRDLVINRKIIDRTHADYVLFSDSSTVMNCNLRDFINAHAESGCPVSIMYKKEAGRTDRSYLKIDKDGTVKEIARGNGKDKNLFTGCFIINKDLLLRIMEWYKSMDMNDVIHVIAQNIEKFKINAYEYTGYCAIIDTLNDYKKASMELINKEVREELFESERQIYTKTQDEAPTIYRPGSKVKKSLVAAGCVIEGTVENSIIFRSTTIKKGAVVKNSIVMQKSIIETNAIVINAILDKYVHIGRKAHVEGGEDRPILIGKDEKI